MVVDASAILAVLLREDDAALYLSALDSTPRLHIGVVNLFEVMVRMDRIGAAGEADRIIANLGLVVEPATSSQTTLARLAHLKFGKGRHPARLNMGDCFAYALAMELGEPLLFKGGDFALTDVARAV